VIGRRRLGGIDDDDCFLGRQHAARAVREGSPDGIVVMSDDERHGEAPLAPGGCPREGREGSRSPLEQEGVGAEGRLRDATRWLASRERCYAQQPQDPQAGGVGCRAVLIAARSFGQALAIGGRQEEVPLVGVEEAQGEVVGEAQRGGEVPGARARAMQIQQRGEQARDVVEERAGVRTALVEDPQGSPARIGHASEHEVGRDPGALQHGRLVAQASAQGEARDRVAVPGRHALAVGARRRPPGSPGEEVPPLCGEGLAGPALDVPEHGRAVLEVACLADPVGACKHLRALGPERLAELAGRPHVESSLDPLAVRVLAGVEAAFGADHLPLEPREGLALRPDEVVMGAATAPPRLAVAPEQQALVVEHLLEVGHAPVTVHAVAVEAPAEVVVEAAPRHLPAGPHHEGENLGTLCLRQHVESREQCVEMGGRRELGALAEASVLVVRRGEDRPRGARQRPDPRRLLGDASWPRAQRRDQPPGLLVHALAVGRVCLRCRLEHLAERRHPLARLRGEVGAGMEGPAVGRAEHGEGPAPVPGQAHQRVHVELVDVRSLLAVHLHAHVEPVHDGGGLGVLEGLPLHDVAPVTGAVADGDEERLVLLARPLEGLGAPGMPIDRVVHVLPQVGARLARQPVRGALASPIHAALRSQAYQPVRPGGGDGDA
jgi:hypothetical protein